MKTLGPNNEKIKIYKSDLHWLVPVNFCPFRSKILRGYFFGTPREKARRDCKIWYSTMLSWTAVGYCCKSTRCVFNSDCIPLIPRKEPRRGVYQDTCRQSCRSKTSWYGIISWRGLFLATILNHRIVAFFLWDVPNSAQPELKQEGPKRNWTLCHDCAGYLIGTKDLEKE